MQLMTIFGGQMRNLVSSPKNRTVRICNRSFTKQQRDDYMTPYIEQTVRVFSLTGICHSTNTRTIEHQANTLRMMVQHLNNCLRARQAYLTLDVCLDVLGIEEAELAFQLLDHVLGHIAHDGVQRGQQSTSNRDCLVNTDTLCCETKGSYVLSKNESKQRM